jgi:ATP-binding cassette subfamily C protein LapB
VETREDPLLDALVYLARLHGRTASRTALVAGLPLVQNRLTVELFARAAERADLAASVVKRPLRKISDLLLPALLLEDRQVGVLVERNDGSAKLLLPETGMGEQEVSADALEKMYTGYSIFVRPRFRPERNPLEEPGHPGTRTWFWGTLFKSWRIYRDVFLASFLINLFGLACPFFVLNVYDRVIPNNAVETLWVLAIGITVIYVFALVMRALLGYFVDEAGKKADLRLSSMLMQKVLGLRMEVRPKSIGSFSKNLQEFESIRDFITSFSITALIDLPFVGLGLFVIWYLAKDIVLIHIGAILLLLIYAVIIQGPLRKAVANTFAASAQKNALLVEGLSGLEAVKMLGAESQVQRAWEEAVAYIARWSVRSRLLSSSVSHFSFFIQSMVVVAVVVAGVYKIAEGLLSTGGLIALVILSRQAVAPMAQVVNLATRYHRAQAALKSLNSIMELPVERPAEKSFLHRTGFQGAIGVKNLTFAYPGQAINIINDITLDIAAGEKVGIIGPIGSGKTTLGKLVLGLYEPTGGMVSMDGTDIRQIDPAELRRFIGYVPQDIMLFRGSVRDNITIGTRDVDDAQIMNSARVAVVDRFVQKNPMGYDMEVEEGAGASPAASASASSWPGPC